MRRLGGLLISRTGIGRLAGFGAFLSALAAGYNFKWVTGQEFSIPYPALRLTALTVVLLAVASFLLRPAVHTFQITPDKAITNRIRWPLIVVAVAVFLLLGEADRHFLLADLSLSSHVQMFLFLGGVALLLYGLGAFQHLSLAGLRRLPRLELGLLAAATLIGFAVRVYRLDDLVHIMIDEIHLYNGVLALINVPNMPIFRQQSGYAAFPYVYAYANWVLVSIFGPSLGSMRLFNALIGTLTIPAVFWLARNLFDWRTGLLAAFLLAVFPPHIHFSRLIQTAIDPFFGVLAFAFLIRGLRHNRHSDYVIAGAMLAFSGLFYEGGRLVFLGVAAIYVIFALVTWRSVRQWHWRGLALLFVTYLLISLPYLIALTSPDYYFMPRVELQGVRLKYLMLDLQSKPALDVLRAHWDNALQYTFYHTIYSMDRSRFYYGGNTGILLWYLVPFYLLGLFFTLFRAFRAGSLLWLWVVSAILGISLVVSTDWTVRFVLMFPAMVVLVACGLRYVPEMLWPARLNKRLLGALIGGAALLIGIANLTYYFGEHIPFYNHEVREGALDFYDAFYTVIPYPGETRLYYLTDKGGSVFNPVLDVEIALRKLNMKYEVLTLEQGTLAWFAALPRGVNLAFVVEPQATGVIDALLKAFPDASGPLKGLVDTVPEDRRYAVFFVRAGESR